MILDKDMIKDPKCNMIINNYYQTKDYIIISNQQLYNHLKDIVPESHFIYSTTLGIKDINLINTLSKNNIVVLDYNYNNNDDILQQLLYPQNIEILCAELCIDNCPYRREHYRAVSKQNAHLELNQDELELMPCKMKDKLGIKRFSVEIYLKTFKHAISNERIEKLSQLGFQYFKIAGRGRSLELCLQFLIYYLILP